MLKLGATTLPLAGWLANPQRPEESQAYRLAAIRQLIREYGLSAVELTADLGLVYPQIFGADFYAAVARLQQELGFTCTVHLPFLWVDLCSLNELVRRASVEGIQKVVEWGQPVAVKAYVLHLWGLATSQIYAALQGPQENEAIGAALMGQARRSLEEICAFVDPGMLCVENLEDALFDRILPVLEVMGTGFCLDVGHLAGRGQDAPAFWSRHRGRIREVHLHDVEQLPAVQGGPVRDHLALGQGQVDYIALLQELERSGFEHPVILEVNRREDLVQSVAAIEMFL